MSTTRDVEVAIRYSASECSILLKLDTASFRERGADLAFVSAFPQYGATFHIWAVCGLPVWLCG